MSKKKTPLVWYVKWIATMAVLVSVSFRYAGVEYHVLDLAFGSAGAVMWLWVSILWNDHSQYSDVYHALWWSIKEFILK